MKKLRFFDCNCAVGKKVAPPLWTAWSPSEIAAQMEYCGIDLAFAWHNLSLDYHPLDGNEQMLIVTKKQPLIRPVFVAMPNQTGEFMDPDALCSMMRKNDVKMARLFPNYNNHAFSLSDWQCGELFEAFEKNGVVVLIDLEQTDWDTIRRVCLMHSKMNVIITNIYYRNYRYAVPLLKQLSNLYIDSSGLKINNGLDELVQLVSAKKILFGTNGGNLSMGAAVCMVTYSSISQIEKELVASGNIACLLNLEVSA